MQDYKDHILDVPDFPEKGIVFKDITPLFQDALLFKNLIQDTASLLKDVPFNKLLLIESRGFLFGSALAFHLGVPFALARKPGKLPRDTHKVSYGLEYGSDVLELQKGDLGPEDQVLVVDDLLATGGTLSAAEKLINISESRISGHFCVIELGFLKGVENLEAPFYKLFSF